MPLLDSFKVDHEKMDAPGVRLAKLMKTPNGDEICVFDLRFFKPNKEIMGERGTHTLEHLFAGFMRDHLNEDRVEIIDISPMGCRTGFYMSVIGHPSDVDVVRAWGLSMRDILGVATQKDIPELNPKQCGSYKMHSLNEAREIARHILAHGIGIIKNEDIMLEI